MSGRRKTITTTTLALALLAPLAATAAPLTVSGPVKVVDGDTVDINIDGTPTRVRIVNIDTPETHKAHCANELTLGLKAKERLRVLLDGGTVTFRATGRDRWRRTLAFVFVDGVDAGATLVKEKHALPWAPGPRAKAARLAVWCDR